MTEDHADRLGRLADELDAVLHTAKLPLPPSIHLTALTKKVREARDVIAEVVRAYRPKPKTKPAKKRLRKRRKIAKERL